MTNTSITASGLSPDEVIEHLRRAQQTAAAAAAHELAMALEWARLHPCPVEEIPAHWGEVDLHGESICPLAGEGAPWVAEFAPADLGAALGISLEAAKQLLADALELTYRLPRVWALVHSLAVPAWRARAIAKETRDLSLAAAAFADRLIAATPHKIGSVHAARLVQEARLYFDPDRSIADEEQALSRRGVWSRPGGAPATTELWMTLDTPDAELFDHSLSRVAGDLKLLGDTDTLDVCRARAVGVLADPQYALDLMSGREGAAPTSGAGGVANLFMHLTPEDLEADLGGGTGAVTIEKLGAATTQLLTDWLTRLTSTGGKVILRPVLDLAGTTAVDQHDPSAAMREQVLLRDAHCVFPGCGRDSRACDLDHIEPYIGADDGGPPGQTRSSNLAPLCRHHHRVKTHTGWDYRRLDGGGYAWTAPTGHAYETESADRRPPASSSLRQTTVMTAGCGQIAIRDNTDEPDRPRPDASPRRGHRHAHGGRLAPGRARREPRERPPARVSPRLQRATPPADTQDEALRPPCGRGSGRGPPPGGRRRPVPWSGCG